MKRGKWGVFGILAAVLLFSACGRKEEAVVTEMGVDGYVYVSRKVNLEGMGYVDSLRIVGDSLYYALNSTGIYELKRLPVSKVEEAAGQWGIGEKGERVFAVSVETLELPGKAEETGEAGYIEMLHRAMEESTLKTSGQIATVDPEKEYCQFFPLHFAVDKDGTVVCSIRIYAGSFFGMEPVGSLLCGQTPEGVLSFCFFQPGIDEGSFAMDGKGRLLVTAEEGIQVLNGDGTQAGVIGVEKYRGGNYYWEELCGNGAGDIYYLVSGSSDSVCRLVEEGNSFSLKEEKDIICQPGGDFVGVEQDGSLLISRALEGGLWRWNQEKGELEELLRWQDCDMIDRGIRTITEIAPGRLLASYSGGNGSGVYLLDRTALEDLPQKEMIVLASFYPDSELWEEVMEFNSLSQEYRVVVERYGAEDGNLNGADGRLDATMISSHPPDILDLSSLDVLKYTKQDALEDLEPWLEESSLGKEDFLDSIVEGYTIDGRLVCIPTGFRPIGLWGRTSQVGEQGKWTMEDVYAWSEENPEAALVQGVNRDYLLREFCADYYLEKFVDWENGTCSFDSGEFRKLLDWIGRYPAEGDVGWFAMDQHVPEDTLLFYGPAYNFFDLLEYEAIFGEAVTLLGTPTLKGERNIYCHMIGVLGITAKSNQKEGAWDFLEYHLARDPYSGPGDYGFYFPAQKAQLQKQMKKFTEVDYRKRDINGDPVPEEGVVDKLEVIVDGERISFPNVPPEQAEALISAIEETDFTPRSELEQKVIDIVAEEAESYYNGDKGLEKVIQVIQSRVGILTAE